MVKNVLIVGAMLAVTVTSGNIGGSFFSYSFTNRSVNLLTGAATNGLAKCDIGIMGSAVVGSALLCGFANPASSYQYSNTGTYVKPVNWTGVRETGDRTIELP